MLKPLALALLFFSTAIFACSGDGFDLCRKKVIDSKSITSQTLQIPLQNNKLLIFSQEKPDGKIIKSDPFLGLYLLENPDGFKFPFKIGTNKESGLASVDDYAVVKGKILKPQKSIEELAEFDKPISKLALLLSGCCALEGVSTPNGIIEKSYIERFLNSKESSYGDFGIKIKDVGTDVVVVSSNPFVEGNKFKKGDIILELNGKKVQNSTKLNEEIYLYKPDSSYVAKVKRASHVLDLNSKSQLKTGGGFVEESFLKPSGLAFDRNLNIIQIQKNALKYGLKTGDKLLEINSKSVKNEKEISDIVGGSSKELNLLIQRDGFQFFVKLN